MTAFQVLVQETPTATASRIIEPPPPTSTEVIVAVIAIVFALAAGVVGYRIIRGGRGL